MRVTRSRSPTASWTALRQFRAHSLAASFPASTSSSTPSFPVTMPPGPTGPAPDTNSRLPLRTAPAYWPAERRSGSSIPISRSRSRTDGTSAAPGRRLALRASAGSGGAGGGRLRLRSRSLRAGPSLLRGACRPRLGAYAGGQRRLAPVVLGHVYHGYGGDGLSLLHVHQGDALRGPPLQRYLLHRRAEDDAIGGYEHQLLAWVDQARRHEIARLRRRLEGDDALAAAPLQRVLRYRRALPEPLRGDDQHRLVRPGDVQRDHPVAFGEPDAPHTTRLP